MIDTLSGIRRFAEHSEKFLNPVSVADSLKKNSEARAEIAFFLDQIRRTLPFGLPAGGIKTVVASWLDRLHADCPEAITQKNLPAYTRFAISHRTATALLRALDETPALIEEKIGISTDISEPLRSVDRASTLLFQETMLDDFEAAARKPSKALARKIIAVDGRHDFVTMAAIELPREALLRLEIPVEIITAFQERAAFRHHYFNVFNGATGENAIADPMASAMLVETAHFGAGLAMRHINDGSMWSDLPKKTQPDIQSESVS